MSTFGERVRGRGQEWGMISGRGADAAKVWRTECSPLLFLWGREEVHCLGQSSKA